VPVITRTNIYCDDLRPCSDDDICTRLADHDGDHYDAVTERRWHNTGQAYGRDSVADVGGD